MISGHAASVFLWFCLRGLFPALGQLLRRGNRHSGHLHRTGLQKCQRTRRRRRTGCDNVIDQQHPPACQVCAGAAAKRAPGVLQALLAGKLLLRAAPALDVQRWPAICAGCGWTPPPGFCRRATCPWPRSRTASAMRTPAALPLPSAATQAAAPPSCGGWRARRQAATPRKIFLPPSARGPRRFLAKKSILHTVCLFSLPQSWLTVVQLCVNLTGSPDGAHFIHHRKHITVKGI